jgi:hypothetical protein
VEKQLVDESEKRFEEREKRLGRVHAYAVVLADAQAARCCYVGCLLLCGCSCCTCLPAETGLRNSSKVCIHTVRERERVSE